MQLAILGAGPAGLLFSLLIRRRFPRWQVHVYEQNAADATFGFGVVFSHGALARRILDLLASDEDHTESERKLIESLAKALSA